MRAVEREGLMRVLLADRFEPFVAEGIRAAGAEVDERPELESGALAAALAETRPTVLVVRSQRVDAAALNASDRLALVVRAGPGVDTIDVAEASRRGIFVAHSPGRNAIAVAELAWGLILACDRRIPDQTADLRAGRWRRAEYSQATGLDGRTLGVVGFGRVGHEIAKRGAAFGMRVVAWSPTLTEETADAAGVDLMTNLVNLARLSDVAAVCVPSTPETQGLIGERFLNAMRAGAILVSISRGGVIDEAALAKAVSERGLRAGLDGFTGEPSAAEGTIASPLVSLPGVYGTHHVAGMTEQAQRANAAEALRIVTTFLERGTVPDCVNRAAATPATAVLTVRHLNRPGVLAHVFFTLGQAQINVEEMENIVYEGGEAASATIHLSRPPNEEHILTIRKNPNVLGTTLALTRR
jgi:D-3-phosphoglycerate dehydrogenase